MKSSAKDRGSKQLNQCVVVLEWGSAFVAGKPAEQYMYQRVMSCCSLESFI